MSGSGETFGRTLITLAQIVFSLLFPFLAISVCGLAYVLTFVLHIGQFALLAFVGRAAIEFAAAHLWARFALFAVGVGSLSLVKIAYREHATRVSSALGEWIAAGIVGGATVFLTVAWPLDFSLSQAVVFAILLFMTWTGICEAALSTWKLLDQSLPKAGRKIVEAQKAHGDARVASEAEAHLLLNPKK